MQKAAQTGDVEYLGRTLDARYRLDAVIGAGAIGRVYAGTQLAVDRKVAIKLLHPSVHGRELGTERFLREAKAVARLSDASCLTLFDFGLDRKSTRLNSSHVRISYAVFCLKKKKKKKKK